MSRQKLLIITSHINHPDFDKFEFGSHGIIVDESLEVNKYLNDGWKIKSITAANIPGGNSSYGYSYAIVIEKE